MKQHIEINQWQELTEKQQEFFLLWKQKKGYKSAQEITIGECLEFLIACSYNYHKEDADGRFFNNIIKNAESSIGWDGQEFIDILWFEVVKVLKARLSGLPIYEHE